MWVVEFAENTRKRRVLEKVRDVHISSLIKVSFAHSFFPFGPSVSINSIPWRTYLLFLSLRKQSEIEKFPKPTSLSFWRWQSAWIPWHFPHFLPTFPMFSFHNRSSERFSPSEFRLSSDSNAPRLMLSICPLLCLWPRGVISRRPHAQWPRDSGQGQELIPYNAFSHLECINPSRGCGGSLSYVVHTSYPFLAVFIDLTRRPFLMNEEFKRAQFSLKVQTVGPLTFARLSRGRILAVLLLDLSVSPNSFEVFPLVYFI